MRFSKFAPHHAGQRARQKKPSEKAEIAAKKGRNRTEADDIHLQLEL